MDSELAAATSFLSAYVPSAHQGPFSAQLHSQLADRYAGHWHLADPERGSAFRALVRNGGRIDHSLVSAGSLLASGELEAALSGSSGRVPLGERWTLWVDPGCVSLRVERMDGASPGVGREGQFIEIYGKLPESLRSHAIPLDAVTKPSLNRALTTTSAALPLQSPSPPVRPSTASPPPDGSLVSPTKRSSKAIQILRPPSRVSSASFALGQALALDSPPPVPALPAMLASPFVIPPTPARPAAAAHSDVFSPCPSPSQSSSGSSNLTLSAPLRPHTPSFSRRSSSRGSFSSASSDADDDGVFSSTESLSSSITSAGTLWKADDGSLMDGEFKYPPLPSARPAFAFPGPPPALHHRSHSSTTALAPPSLFSPPPPSPSTKSPFANPRSLPNSPTKPRRRGTRGGGSSAAHHASLHEHSSSISSISSADSSASNSRTREQALAGTLTEHSGGKVGVLGGGVLLGLASAKMMGSARAEVVGEAKRRGRERRRGGTAQRPLGWEQQAAPMGAGGPTQMGHYYHAQGAMAQGP